MKVYAAYPYSNLKVSVLGGADLIPTAGTDSPARTYALTGISDGSEEAIVATYRDSSRTKYAGGLWTATYKNEPFKLYLVPMPGITISDVDRGTLQQNLNNKIFSQAVITWTVGALPGFTSVDLGTNGLDWADNAMLSSYNTEMNSVISAFKEFKADADPEAYYLFIVPGFSESGVEGFMPRNRRFGFVTLEQLKDRTVAHELGHGAFNLRHTFPEVPQGATDNLMDYAEGINLYKPQWDLIHNPEFTTGLWDDMEDGAIVCSESFSDLSHQGLKIKDWYFGFKAELMKYEMFKKAFDYVNADPKNFFVSDMNSDEIKTASSESGKCQKGIHTKTYIKLNPSDGCFGFLKNPIFEEFFHAAQYIHYNVGTDNVKLEVEARVAKFYSVYKNLSPDDRKSSDIVNKKLVDFSFANYEIPLLVNSDKSLNSSVQNYFDALISGNSVPREIKNSFKDALKTWLKIYLYPMYSDYFTSKDVEDYDGEIDLFEYFYDLK